MVGYSAQHSIGIAVVLTLSYQNLSSQLTRYFPQKYVAALLKKNSNKTVLFIETVVYMFISLWKNSLHPVRQLRLAYNMPLTIGHILKSVCGKVR